MCMQVKCPELLPGIALAKSRTSELVITSPTSTVRTGNPQPDVLSMNRNRERAEPCNSHAKTEICYPPAVGLPQYLLVQTKNLQQRWLAPATAVPYCYCQQVYMPQRTPVYSPRICRWLYIRQVNNHTRYLKYCWFAELNMVCVHSIRYFKCTTKHVYVSFSQSKKSELMLTRSARAYSSSCYRICYRLSRVSWALA